MPTFLIATGPTIALFATRIGWHTSRKHVSLVPNIDHQGAGQRGIAYPRTLHEPVNQPNRENTKHAE